MATYGRCHCFSRYWLISHPDLARPCSLERACNGAPIPPFAPGAHVCRSSVKVEMKEDPDRGMFCLDWDDEGPIELINASSQDDGYARIDVTETPCNYVHAMLGYEGDSLSSECIGGLGSQEQYVRAAHILMLVN